MGAVGLLIYNYEIDDKFVQEHEIRPEIEENNLGNLLN